MENSGTLTVRGGNILEKPLLVSADARVLEFRDRTGELTCFWRRVFDGSGSELWGYCSKSDPDWHEMCVRYGYVSDGRDSASGSVFGK